MCDVRYALYYIPPMDSVLGQFGSSWLARNERMSVLGLTKDKQSDITKVARAYGFHGTLKAPFFTGKDIGFEIIDDALISFCAEHSAFEVPPLKLSVMDGFAALRPEKKAAKLHDFAAKCVRAFDHFRQPPTAAEMSKRMKANLSDRQIHHLGQWGYPYVMEDFCFHMTLTDQLDLMDQSLVLRVLDHHTKGVLEKESWLFDSVTLVRQKNNQSVFEVVKKYHLGATPVLKTA